MQLRLSDAPKVDVRAGNFKMPFSAIQLESIWTLPMADRGLVDNVLVKRLQVAGRAVGGDGRRSISERRITRRVRAGVFQGRNDAGDPLAVARATTGSAQDGVVRASVRPTQGVEIGASASRAIRGADQSLRSRSARVRRRARRAPPIVAAGPGRIRALAEAMIGTSWLVGGMMPGHDLTRFLEARGIVAYRLGGDRKGRATSSPTSLGRLRVDPDRIITRDLRARDRPVASPTAHAMLAHPARSRGLAVRRQRSARHRELAVAPSTRQHSSLQLGVKTLTTGDSHAISSMHRCIRSVVGLRRRLLRW